MENETMLCGVFVRKIKFVRAKQVTADWEEYIDRNGERFIGLKNDFKLYDQDGNIYYINKHEFLANYAPFDSVAWDIISNWRDKQLKEKERIIQETNIQIKE